MAANSYTSWLFLQLVLGFMVTLVRQRLNRSKNRFRIYYPSRFTRTGIFVCYDEENAHLYERLLTQQGMNDLPRLASAVLPLCSQHPVSVAFFLWRKVWMRLPPGIVGRNGRAYAGCSVLHLAGRYVGRLLFSALLAAAKRGVRVRCCWTTTIHPDLTTFYACLTVSPH